MKVGAALLMLTLAVGCEKKEDQTLCFTCETTTTISSTSPYVKTTSSRSSFDICGQDQYNIYNKKTETTSSYSGNVRVDIVSKTLCTQK